VAHTSLGMQLKEIEAEVTIILSHAAIDELNYEVQKLAADIKRQLTDARLDVRDYEYADTRHEQLRYATEGKKRLQKVRQEVVKASENELFSAVDVAQITARIEAAIEQLS
jgi:predicted Holliday junction resolvase-like endonuclease